MHQEFIAKAQELAHSAAKNKTEEEINSLITSLYAAHRLAEKNKESLEELLSLLVSIECKRLWKQTRWTVEICSLIKKIYEGNICIDTGSAMGSLSLHPRSLTILESNGLLIQSKQVDSSDIWGDLNEKIVFNNIESFLNGIDLVLTDQNKFNEYLDAIYEKFKKSEHKTYEVLKENLKL